MIYILTFDIEKWFHSFEFDNKKDSTPGNGYDKRLERNLDCLLSFLEESNKNATFFVSGWIGRHYPQVVKQILQNGHEIGLRTQGCDIYTKFPEQSFREYIHRNISVIQDLSGQIIKYYRSPDHLINNTKWAFLVLAQEGVEIDSSVTPAIYYGVSGQVLYNTPCWIKSDGIIMKEMPANTLGFQRSKYGFSKNGNIKIQPSWSINFLNKNSDYLMTYFYYRDFEEEEPSIEQELCSCLRYWYAKARKKKINSLSDWIGKHDFITLSQASDKVEWESAGVINLDL